MFRISLQTLRGHRGILAGAFIAIWLSVTLALATGQLMAGALSDPGPGRFAAADYIVRYDPTIPTADGESADTSPGPRVDKALLRQFPRAVGDISFPVGAFAGATSIGDEPLFAHGWSSAALTPYRLASGSRPTGAHDLVVDDRLARAERVRITTPAGEATYRVTGRVHSDVGAPTVFFSDKVAARLSGMPDKVNAIVISGGAKPAATAPLEVLERDHLAEADSADADRVALVAIFGTMGGISGLVALFVVAGTFTLAIVQRRKELAVMRALGAAPHQVRRLIAGEALLVSLVAGALGLVAGGPLADAIVSILADHDVVPAGFAPGDSWIPFAAALGGGVLIAQLAVFAAARRAGRTRPAEALRDAVIEHPRPSILQIASGVLMIAGGVTMALLFKGQWAIAFAILEAMMLAIGVGLLGRVLLGFPAALLARPLRGLGASGLLASTSLAANRWRTAALATPIVLVAMLAGTQGVVQSSSQHDTERVTGARVTAPYVITGRDGAPIPDGTAEQIKADGVAAISATEIYPDGAKLGEEAPWPAAGMTARGTGTLDLKVLAGDPSKGAAISHVFAETGDLKLGDSFTTLMADKTRRTLKVAAIYERAAGLGDVLIDDVPAPVSAIFVNGPKPKLNSTGLQVLTRDEYRDGVHAANQEQNWGVWMIIGLSALFTALALINTAAMGTAERRGELATIRLLGGTGAQAARTVVLETLPTVLVALTAGAAIVAVAVHGVPLSLTGIPLTIPATLAAGVTLGAAALGLLAALVATRLALRASPAEAMRERT